MALSPDTKVRIKVVDVETTTQDGDPDWTHASNQVVLFGMYDPDWWATRRYPDTCEMASTFQEWFEFEKGYNYLIVGHNLLFDIGYLVKERVLTQHELATRVHIWDTMVAEYILSGQQARFNSLEKTCASYEIPFKKNPIIAKHFEEGKGAAGIPLVDLIPYLKEDVRAEYELFLKQYADAEKKGMLPLIQAMMDFRLATIDMRLNGIQVDAHALKNTKELCVVERGVQETRVTVLHTALKLSPCGRYSKQAQLAELDPLKGPQLSSLLYGGDYKQRDVEVVGKYKNGKDKTKIKETIVSFNGLLSALHIEEGADTRSVDEETLGKVVAALIAARLTTATTAPAGAHYTTWLRSMLTSILACRKAAKIISTYVLPSELDAKRFGGKLHPTLHVTATSTGRTSCASPNLQNVPKKSLGLYRKSIVPTSGKVLVEFDYKQLEVVALALLTKDSQLIADLVGGVDMHTALFNEVHGRLPTTDERTDFKRAVFCLIYGGGSKAIAAQGNTTVGKAVTLLHKFRNHYPATMEFRQRVLAEVDHNSQVHADGKYNIPHRIGSYQSLTGRVYTFEQKLYDERDWKTGKVQKVCNWSKQEIANYPIQGLATADIAPLMVGMLYRFIHGKWTEQQRSPTDLPRLLIPVHDSILVEVSAGTLKEDVGLMRKFMESVPGQMMAAFGIDSLGLQFKVGVSVGSNWEDMKDYKGDLE